MDARNVPVTLRDLTLSGVIPYPDSAIASQVSSENVAIPAKMDISDILIADVNVSDF